MFVTLVSSLTTDLNKIRWIIRKVSYWSRNSLVISKILFYYLIKICWIFTVISQEKSLCSCESVCWTWKTELHKTKRFLSFFLFFNKIWQTSSFEYHLIQAVYHRFKMFKIIEKILNRNKILIRISLRKDACLSSFKSRSKLVDSSEYSNEWKKIFINIFYIPDIVIFPI